MARGIKPTPELLPLPQAAALVHAVSGGVVPLFSMTRIHWRRRHRVPTVQIGRFVFYPKAELTQWAERFARARTNP
jgi:hypothetical protein